MSTTNVMALDPKPKASTKARRRATKACLSCRARKVRCDVSQRGRPCMNCYLDSETCVVTGRASKCRGSREGDDGVEATHPPCAADDNNSAPTAEDVLTSRINGEPVPPTSAGSGLMPPNNGLNDTSTNHLTAVEVREGPRPALQQMSWNGGGQCFSRNAVPLPSHKGHNLGMPDTSSLLASEVPSWMGDQRLAANADVTYSYYPFLIINNLPNMMTQDINYLESQGCLRVPTRDILDIFMKQYFLHHHPLMPILNEGDFWDMYGQQGMRGSGERMSLLVFQSMLFVVCNYLSQDSIKALGFPSTRIARASLYRRAKLLYDFESESSMVYLAQAALLLSHWSPNFTHAFKKANSTWLSMAIQNAKSVEAHYYSAIPVISAAAHPAQHKRQNTLRRLWWCCIVRDRILPLGLRRSPKITRSHFDFDANPRLGYPDLDDEVHRSKVYNAETKRCLIGIFSQIVDLSIVLTSSLMLVFPLDDSPGWGKRVGAEQSEKVRECKSALRRWYESASLQFPMFGGGTARRINAMKRKESRHDSVILYTNMMYMYYHSSRVALSHHEVLQTAAAFVSPIDNLQDFSSIYENRRELQDATSGVTECLKELIQLRLARWLPISAVACTAFPLCLHIIDVNLSPHKLGSSSAPPSAQQAAKQHQLNILIAAMKTYQPQYDGVDYVSETIRHIVNLAQLDSPTPPSASNKISGWTDILASQPGCYLRLAMTMDLSFAKGRLPVESDFPASLQGLFTTGYSSVKALMRNGIATTSLTQHSPRLPNFNDARGPSPVNPTPPDRAFNAATTNLLIAENADASRALSEMHGGHGIVHLPSTESFIDASLKIEGIMSEILVPYTLQDDASSRSSSNSHSHGAGGVSYEATEEETADDWIGTAWGNEADVRMLGGEDGSDQETAQLLHALRESTGSGVTWRGKESA